jgi:C4-dicarboxylate-specific signal transduction histidine kinase
MKRDWKHAVGRTAGICAAGIAALTALSYLFFGLRFGFAQAGFLLLMVVTLAALLRSYVASIVLSLTAVACLTYFFVPPVFSFVIVTPQDFSALAAFLTTSLIIAGLTTKIQELADQRLEKTRAELTYFARVATLGELTASIAREVDWPLASVIASGDACRRWLASAPPDVARAAQSVESMIRDASSAHAVVERVRGLAQKAAPQKIKVDVNRAVLEVVAVTRPELEHGRVALRLQLASDLPPISADKIQLQQVLLSLIVNAIESIAASQDEPRDLTVTTSRSGAGQVLFAVRDSGKGSEREAAAQFFDAAAKADEKGVGFAVSRAIVEAHGGRLWSAPNEPRGAVFQFTLPVGDKAAD